MIITITEVTPSTGGWVKVKGEQYKYSLPPALNKGAINVGDKYDISFERQTKTVNGKPFTNSVLTVFNKVASNEELTGKVPERIAVPAAVQAPVKVEQKKNYSAEDLERFKKRDTKIEKLAVLKIAAMLTGPLGDSKKFADNVAIVESHMHPITGDVEQAEFLQDEPPF